VILASRPPEYDDYDEDDGLEAIDRLLGEFANGDDDDDDDGTECYAVSPVGDNPHKCTLIYLHGLTLHGEDYLDGSSHLPWAIGDEYAPGLRAVLPSAVFLPQPWGGQVPSWYTYVSQDSNAVGDESTLTATRERLLEYLESEVELLKGEGHRIFLGGCSQGCIVALDTFLREGPRLGLGGFVGSLGCLPSDELGFTGADAALEDFIRSEQASRRPIWLQCGLEDEEVPWKLVQQSLVRVKGRLPGLFVRELEGYGHDIEDKEVDVVNQFVRTYASDAYYEHNVELDDGEYYEGWFDDIGEDIGEDIGLEIGRDIQNGIIPGYNV